MSDRNTRSQSSSFTHIQKDGKQTYKLRRRREANSIDVLAQQAGFVRSEVIEVRLEIVKAAHLGAEGIKVFYAQRCEGYVYEKRWMTKSVVVRISQKIDRSERMRKAYPSLLAMLLIDILAQSQSTQADILAPSYPRSPICERSLSFAPRSRFPLATEQVCQPCIQLQRERKSYERERASCASWHH